MNERHKTEKSEITEKTKLPLSLVLSIVGLSVYLTFIWLDLRNQVQGCITQDQAQRWVDRMRDDNPGIKVPPIPAKIEAAQNKLDFNPFAKK